MTFLGMLADSAGRSPTGHYTGTYGCSERMSSIITAEKSCVIAYLEAMA